MTDKFEKALRDNQQAILDGLRHDNSYARAQTIALLELYGAFDQVFIDAVSECIGDSGQAVFGMTVGDVAERYLAASAA